MAWPTKSLKASLFRPSTSLAGSEPPTILRGENAVLRGPQGQQYFEVFSGNKDLGEDYNLAGGGFVITGTITTTAGSPIVAGSGTAFRDELHVGQVIEATNGEVFAVKEVISQTSFLAYNNALASTGGLTAYRLPQFWEIDRKRGVSLTGNAIETPKGHKVGAGSGTVYINGQVLPGTSLVLSRTPKAAIYRPQTDDYDIRPLGFAGTPPLPVLTVLTSGGVKRMEGGTRHSFKFTYWSGDPDGVNGHGNPGDPLKLDGSAVEIFLTNDVSRFQFDLTTSLVGMPSHAKGFIIWKSRSGRKTVSDNGSTLTENSANEGNFQHGPWYRAAKVKVASQTFPTSDVNTGTDRITLANHPFETGERVYHSATVTAMTATGIGAPIAATTPIYIIKIDQNTVQLATTKANALAGTAADITGAGSGTLTLSYLSSGDIYIDEWLDEDLYEQLSGDNFTPPDCEFISMVEQRPMAISCFGKRSNTSSGGTNPGPLVNLGKFANPDGYPDWGTAGGNHNILGFFEGVGRTFTMTPSSLDFVTPTGLLGQAAQGLLTQELALIWRPYWKTGAANRYSILLDDDTIYGRSGGKFFRSIGNGDENVRKYDFGSVVEDVTREWNDGFAYTARNPKDGQVCFVRSAAYKNANGYWVSEIWPFSIWSDAWLPKIVLSRTDRDQIICGVATVDEKFEFLCGGRVSGGTYQVKTFRFADGEAGGSSIPWYVVWQVTDDGVEELPKRLHSFQMTAKLTSPIIQVHGARPGQRLSVSNIETGTGADANAYFSGDINMPTTAALTDYLQRTVRLSGLSNYAIRIAGTWSTSDAVKDRLDELVVEVSPHGRAR